MWGGVRFDLALNENEQSKRTSGFGDPSRKYQSSPALIPSKSAPKNSPFARINDKLMFKILSYLDTRDLCRFQRVCKRFSVLATDNCLWEKFYKKQFHSHTDYASTKKYKQWYIAEVLVRRNQKKQQALRSKSSGGCCSGPTNYQRRIVPNNGIRMVNERRGSNRALEGFKIVMLGDSGSGEISFQVIVTIQGKSSTLIRLHENKFIEAYHATIGASFIQETLIVDDRPVKLAIWDTAGSERYFALLPMYYRGSDAAIVVFSIVNIDSYEQAKHFIKEIIERVNPRPVIALVGNKLDLEKYRQVSTKEAQLYALDNDLIYLEISAKTGDNVLETFVEVSKQLVRGLSRTK